MSSYSSESGNSPPRRRVRLETQSSTEERYSGPAPTAGEEESGGGHHESVIKKKKKCIVFFLNSLNFWLLSLIFFYFSLILLLPQEVVSNHPQGAGEHTAVGDVVQGPLPERMRRNYMVSISTMNSSSIWWRNASHSGTIPTAAMQTRSLWMEICGKILTDWDDLSEGKQEDCKTAVMVRWRTIRDRYKKDYNEEVNRPSGSGGTRRQPYRYAAALGFLRRTLELRRTTSSTRAPEPPCEGHQEAVPAELPPADPSPPRPAPGQDPNRPLLVPSGDATMAVMAPLFEALMRRQRAGRSRQADYEDLTRFLYETLCGYSNRIVAMEAELRSLRECVAQFSQPGPLQPYWLSVNQLVADFTPDQVLELRRRVEDAVSLSHLLFNLLVR
ncbi:uncharacterized protein LOC121008773 [Bufo bufo]|uniref:uncharacterized protein LOC121008773 n=1 Tax=Bufo bufo TaxID=8384 RepID=UPI001ABDBEC7|nr:uncharacterized protein LOC121008773 [Bufo bufo]